MKSIAIPSVLCYNKSNYHTGGIIMTFEHIITVCEDTTKYISGLESMNAYTPYITIKLYGVPDTWEDEKIEECLW